MARDYGGARGGQPWHGSQPPYPGQPRPQQPYPGQPYPEQPYPGQPYPGQAYPGQPQRGQPYPEQPHQGQPYPGQPYPEQPYSGQPYPGQPYPGQQRPGQPHHGQPYQDQPGHRLPQWVPSPNPGAGFAADPAAARRRRVRLLAVTLLTLGVVGFFGSVAGLASQVMPRRFTAAQQQQITDWEAGKRWRALPASVIFPTSVNYKPPASLSDDQSLALSAQRVGIASQASCAAATDPTAAAVLDRDGCTAMLRATYVDETGSYVVTVGAAVLPGATRAAAAAKAIAADGGSDGLGPTVHTVTFSGTLAASFTDGRRQVSGVLSGGTYVVLYTVGYADSRQRQPVAGDTYAYGEMTSSGAGVAHAVLSELAAPVPPPHCPGTPGC